jgi:transcriptional regulator with XRE-family HTH domain
MRTIALRSTPQEAMLALAKFIKTIRLNQEMTLEDLAIRAGTSRSTLMRFEKLGAGSTETMIKTFAALGVLDALVTVLAPPEKQLTISELKKMSTGHQRQRGRRKARGIS